MQSRQVFVQTTAHFQIIITLFIIGHQQLMVQRKHGYETGIQAAA